MRRLAYVNQVRRAGKVYLFYRRGGHSVSPLPQPENSAVFMAAYHAAERRFLAKPAAAGETVNDAVQLYYQDASFRQLRPNSQRDYRRVLDWAREQWGELALIDLDETWINEVRNRSVERPIWWNALRSRMIEVVRAYRRARPKAMLVNPWEGSGRLKVEKSHAHRPWPPEVLIRVLRATTPEFRALLIGYLLTAQRGGDVTRFERHQYDRAARTLTMPGQQKTDESLVLHVPAGLAVVLEAMAERHPTRLFVTTRGQAWTTINAQGMLRTLLRNLGLPRYTLHGLRATGPVALKMLGFENRAIRALTGHTSDQNLEVYLRGVDHYPLARQAQEALDGAFSGVMTEALEGANQGKAAGVTGRAAAKLKLERAQRALQFPSQPPLEENPSDPLLRSVKHRS